MPQVHVSFARFPFGNSEAPSSSDWVIDTTLKAKADPRIHTVSRITIDDTPITMSRNRCLWKAREMGVDVLAMIDSDMFPDLYLKQNGYGVDEAAKPFWDTAFNFLLDHSGPCVIGAPYCGPPPHENIFVFRCTTLESNHPNQDFRIVQFTREDAALRTGVEEVAALPTGLVLINMKALDYLPKDQPFFDYEWTNEKMTDKASTEDVFFTRNLQIVGVPQYCLWDCWAGHWKRKCVGKPMPVTMKNLAEDMHQAFIRARENPLVTIAEKKELPAHEGNGKPTKVAKRVKK